MRATHDSSDGCPLPEIQLDRARSTAEEVAATGALLARAGFSERNVCAWLGAPLVSDARYVTAPAERSRRGLGAWIALLVAGETVPRADLVGPVAERLDLLLDLGLLSCAAGRVTARVSVVPFGPALVAADRLDCTARDAVLSPDLSAWNLAACLPPRPTALLDVGCGAGAIALRAAWSGARVTGTDIDPRALRFAALNSLLNGRSADWREGDLFAGEEGRFDCVCFNAPLLRAAMAGDDAPLYLRSTRGEALAAEFLAGARARTVDEGECLLHAQLTPGVAASLAEAGFAEIVELQFASATDGTPHGLAALRDGHPAARRRFRVPVGPALPHLRREVVERLRATAGLLADEAALDLACLRPAPWLVLSRSLQHDGAAFRPREVRLGDTRLAETDVALLERCDGRPLADVAADDHERLRLRALAELGLLVA